MSEQTLRAYSVAEVGGDFQELIFATSARRAKALAWGSGLFECDWIDLRVVRVPNADRFAGDTPRHVKHFEWFEIAEELGWPM